MHVNELREATELLRRGRWEMPIYWPAGIFSILPDTPWIGGVLANNGTHEVRSIGHAYLRRWEDPLSGLGNVRVLASSRVNLRSQRACGVAVYQLDKTISWTEQPPTWSHNPPDDWDSPGGLGGGATYMGSAGLALDVPSGQFIASISGGSVAAGLQAIVDGARQNFIARRTDTSDPITAELWGSLEIEFELNTPSN